MRIKAGVHWFDYVFVLRPMLFLPVWTVFLAGFIGAWSHKTSDAAFFVVKPIWKAFLGSPAWLLLIMMTMLCGSSFVLNQLRDVETDRVNKKLFLVADGIVSYRAAFIEAVMLLVPVVIGAFWLNLYQGLLFTFAFIITGWFYNFRPFEWKNHPIGGLVTNAMVTAIIFCSGWFAAGDIGWTAVFYSVSYVAAVTAVYLLTTIPDESGDRATGKITWVVRFGRKSTYTAALFCCLFAFASAAFMGDWLMGIAAGISLPLFGGLVFARKESLLLPAIKMPILFLTLIVVLKMPYYFGLIALTILGSRWYYRKRFNMIYPNLSKK